MSTALTGRITMVQKVRRNAKNRRPAVFFDTSTVFWKNKTGGSSGDYFSCNFRDHSFCRTASDLSSASHNYRMYYFSNYEAQMI